MTTFNRLIDFNTVPFLERVVYGNTVQAWLAALVCALVLAFVLVRLKVYAIDLIRAAAARTRVKWDDDASSVLSRTKAFVLAGVAFYAVSQGLVLGVRLQRVLEIGFLAFVFFQLLLWLDAVSHIAVRRALKSEYESHGDLASPKAVILSFLLRFVVYVFVFLLFLDNLGVNITALVTGLGLDRRREGMIAIMIYTMPSATA